MRQSGYSFRGYRAEVHRQLSKWNPRIKAIPIICTEGLIEIGIHRGTTNGDVFLQFLNERRVLFELQLHPRLCSGYTYAF